MIKYFFYLRSREYGNTCTRFRQSYASRTSCKMEFVNKLNDFKVPKSGTHRSCRMSPNEAENQLQTALTRLLKLVCENVHKQAGIHYRLIPPNCAYEHMRARHFFSHCRVNQKHYLIHQKVDSKKILETS